MVAQYPFFSEKLTILKLGALHRTLTPKETPLKRGFGLQVTGFDRIIGHAEVEIPKAEVAEPYHCRIVRHGFSGNG